MLTNWFVERWQGRMINIRPSLLPLFRGTHTHRRALEEGVLVHGCTVHFVVPEFDAGPIVGQHILVQEHRIYPAALTRWDSEGTLGSPV